MHGSIVRVRPGEAGHRIVKEAQEAHADAIVMPMPSHRTAGRLLNKTLEVVLGKRPCRVIIDSARAQPLDSVRPAVASTDRYTPEANRIVQTRPAARQ